MATTIERNQWHVVEEDENVPLIGKYSGFRNWRAVYEHAKNADFRRNNPDPFAIRIGDKIWIPEKSPGPGVLSETGKEHKFALGSFKVPLTLTLMDDDGVPYADMLYGIMIEDAFYGDTNRRTTAEGKIATEVPNVPELYVFLWEDEEDEDPLIFTVRLGGLNPIDTVDGVRDRLSNLGYDCGDAETDGGPEFLAALKEFQADCGLQPTGELDEETRRQLQLAHYG